MNKVKPNGRRFMRRVTVGFETRRRRRRRKRIISPQSSRTYFNKSEGRGGKEELGGRNDRKRIYIELNSKGLQ